MKHEDHKARHLQLHTAFDELLADFIRHNPNKRPSKTPIGELMLWSSQQTQRPDGNQHVEQSAPPRKLTWIDWLEIAHRSGYEAGFSAEPCKELLQLESRGYIERDPSTTGKDTHWRITLDGQRFCSGSPK